MSLFDLFGGKKNAAKETEEEREKELALKKEKELEEIKKAHQDLEWPVIQRLNPVNVKDVEGSVMEETVTAERKDEIGAMIYLEEIPQDSLKFLSGQEILFLLTTLEAFNKKAPLPEFEKNRRTVYNELLARVRDAEKLYVLYDNATGYPFIDHGFANIYFEKEIADKAVEMFDKQFRKLSNRECPVEVKGPDGRTSSFFDFLYYIGIDNLIVDNGAYRARFKRNEIVANPFDWGEQSKDPAPVNPTLNFALLDFVGEMKWPVKYEKRQEVLQAKEMRMLSQIRAARFIVPMQHEGPAEVGEKGQIKLTKDTKIKFLVMKTADGKQFLPIYTDGMEFRKFPKLGEWNVGVFAYQDILKFIQDKDGIRINPEGVGIVIPRDRLMALEAAAAQAQVEKQKVQAKKATVEGADAAVKKALDQALSHMDDKQ